MQPVDELHRHCNSCNRVLTDFTQMSDTELVLWMKHNKGKVCGRFSKNQLDRPYVLPPAEKKSKFPVSMFWMLLLTWAGTEAKAQQNPGIIKSKPPVSVSNKEQQTAAGTSDSLRQEANIPVPGFPAIINGKVLEKESNEAFFLVKVSLEIDGIKTAISCTTDTGGNYVLRIPENILCKEITLVYSFINYATEKRTVLPSRVNKGKEVTAETVNLKPEVAELDIVGILIETYSGRDSRSFWSKLRLGFGFGK